MDKKSLLFAVGIVVVVGLSVTFISESPDKEMIVVGITAVYVVAYFFFFRKKVTKKEKEIKAKIEELKSEGQDLALVQEADFNEDDLKLLFKRKKLLVLSFIGGTLVLCAISTGTIQVIRDIENKIFWQSIALIIILSGFGWLFFRDIQKLSHHILTGKKTIVRGIVTHKRIDGDETDTHFLEIDSLSVYVGKKIYDKYEVGDGIEIHVFKPHHNMLLYEAKIESMNLK